MLLKKQGATGGARARPQTASADKSPTVTQQRSVGVGQRLRLGSLGVCSSLMGNFTALPSFTLLTGLFAKQLLIYKGCNILHRMFWCGPQQSCSWLGACRAGREGSEDRGLRGLQLMSPHISSLLSSREFQLTSPHISSLLSLRGQPFAHCMCSNWAETFLSCALLGAWPYNEVCNELVQVRGAELPRSSTALNFHRKKANTAQIGVRRISPEIRR